ncbi:chain length determinant protein tyrosine kinase EpsG [Massilia sp. IC2-278]|uniref:chain length determinant protein tyrosine kinase EpsG n=1 Tax=Massilia sp. IC2-278 TaxID=2887200 RepID=UPI001E4C6FF5|nr:chain length determinant protein tyrosine kinase EpsG [Massilia sp. IC2-278]MCC2962415.1 chain length determinant protein tyrosine kinase EpsG [Massilia sp. IC2-278]
MNSPILSPLPVDPLDSSMGALLVDAGKLTLEGAERALRMQKDLGIRFGEAAVRLGLVSEDDVQEALARQFAYPYLPKGQANLSPRLVAAYEPFSPQVESLRAIRSQLMLRWFARGHRALAVLGADPDDGAALFAANLAVVFSQLGEQTLLVDANLRAPRQHDVFGLRARQGLSDLLAGRADLDVVLRVGGFVDLSVLPAGTLPPNPQELLSRDTFRTLDASLASRYDVVLYDLAPFGAGADALAVAARAGGVLLAVRKDHTRVVQLARMSEQLAEAGAEVVGAVVMEF